VETPTSQRRSRERPQSWPNPVDTERAQAAEARIGEVLRRARRHRQWSLRDVERRTGIPNPYLSQIERGQVRRPDVEVLWALSELYSLDFARIAVWSGHLDESPTGPRASLAVIALRALSQLDPDAQVEAIRYMERLAQGSDRTDSSGT
jgi:transcriptional regulator with XRE-family HTH domain